MRSLLLVLILFPVTAALAADDADPIKAKLDKAKTTYQAARDKNRDFLVDILTKQADVARKAGKADLVEKVTKALDEYKKGGPLPGGLAADVKRRFSTTRAAMEVAYATAVAEGTKAKKDDFVADVKKDWEAFKLDASDDPTVVRLMIKHAEKYITMDDADRETEAKQNSQQAGNSQYFRMSTATNGVVMFSSLDGKRWLGTSKGAVAQETHITMAPRRTGAAAATQQWAIQPLPEGYFRIVHVPSKKVLCVLGRSKGDNATLVIWTGEKDNEAQDWKFD